VAFFPADILSVETGEDHGRPAIHIRLSPRLDDAFAALTKDKGGTTITLRVCGKTVVEAVIMAQVKTAQFDITSSDAEAIAAEADFLRHPPCLMM
jgi:preprotein translocase subunit SecD